jgi:uncharacterized membrane protein
MRTYPKPRIDALTDGVFAFAMTLLVLEVRLPEGLVVRDSAALIAALRGLGSQYLTYVISFFVLAAHWRGVIELRRTEEVSHNALGWATAYLFFITSVPFASSVVGRYGDLPPAVWLYAANMIAVAALSLRLRTLEILPEHRALARSGNMRTALLIASALVSVGLSFVVPGHAMYAYFLNFLSGPLARWRGAEL